MSTRAITTQEPCGEIMYNGPCKSRKVKVHSRGHAWCAYCGAKKSYLAIKDDDLPGSSSYPSESEPTEQETKMTGIELIAAERLRQVEEEGWTPEHDAAHTRGEIAKAAACYASPDPIYVEQRGGGSHRGPRDWITFVTPWPWSFLWWKSTNRIRDLVKAGALIAAEIDRLSAVEEEET